MNKLLTHRITVLGTVALIAACSTNPAATLEPSEPPSTAAPEAFVADLDVGGRTLHIVCVGPTDTGRPTVIFEAGLGGDFRTWGDVLGGLKSTDRGCSYDRAGIGASEPAPGPWTTDDQVTDLHALLQAAAVPPPYLLVAHSLGGWNAMVFAERYPAEVVGVVLVDVRPPALSARLLDELPPDTAGESEAIHQNRAELTTFEEDPTLNPEHLDLRTSADQALATSGFGDRPLAVLSAADTAPLWEGLDANLATRLDNVWWELQEGLAELSTAGRHERVEGVDHDIPGGRPDAIIEAILSILAAVRG